MLNRRRLGIAAAVVALVALVALAVAGALALGGDDDESRETGATITEQAGERAAPGETSESETEAPAASDTQEEMAPPLTAEEAPPEPEPEPDPAAPPAEPVRYTPYSSSSGDWQAGLPSGGGWQKPVEAGATAGGRIRTTVRGPNGAVLVIDHTPLKAARFGGRDGARRELSQPWFGSMTEYRLGDDGVGYVLNATESGPGFRVLVTGAEAAVARRVAGSLTFVDL